MMKYMAGLSVRVEHSRDMLCSKGHRVSKSWITQNAFRKWWCAVIKHSPGFGV